AGIIGVSREINRGIVGHRIIVSARRHRQAVILVNAVPIDCIRGLIQTGVAVVVKGVRVIGGLIGLAGGAKLNQGGAQKSAEQSQLSRYFHKDEFWSIAMCAVSGNVVKNSSGAAGKGNRAWVVISVTPLVQVFFSPFRCWRERITGATLSGIATGVSRPNDQDGSSPSTILPLNEGARGLGCLESEEKTMISTESKE